MTLITSENQVVCFPSFVLTVFCYSTSYTVIVVLWKMLMEPVNALARWWPCAFLKCVSGLRRLEENLELFEIHTCLWRGAQIWFRHKWRKQVTASLLLRCIDGYSCLRYWNEFFQLWFRFKIEVFLVLHFDGNVCNWIAKVIWARMDWFCVFFGKWLLSSTSYLYELKSARIAQLLFIFGDINFFRCLVWGVFWSVL